MDFITFTDEDSLGGCLEIADRPGAFLSESVSALFPEDGCRVSLLVWGISESQHREIQQLRTNIYELQQYLCREEIAHGVAVRVVQRLELVQIEQQQRAEAPAALARRHGLHQSL